MNNKLTPADRRHLTVIKEMPCGVCGRVLKVKKIDRQWKTAMRRTKFNATPHILRHTVATQLAQKSVPMAQIARILGHRNTQITERVYAKYSPDFCRDAVEHLSV